MTDHYDVAKIVFKTGKVSVLLAKHRESDIVTPIGIFPDKTYAEALKVFLESDVESAQDVDLRIVEYGPVERRRAKGPKEN